MTPEQDEAWDRQVIRGAKQAWFMLGMLVVGIAAIIHEALR